ncbi:hypothetical protein BZG36_03999 [Bifiguratus adelaidae]|uniref:Geranylgeranyl transferase type-1 subunit beta n=1 Tax=Bifiguratus adelaidae TaxID=1938954 RepID=A0A261XYF9_9FUNG|nr:hypothetical protein BZG36_03999 [Bifiguratus adelaidae]
MTDPLPDLRVKKHIAYFKRCLYMLPEPYTESDTNRMTLACFCLSGLDLLGAIETDLTAEERQQYIEWIYAQQVHPSQIEEDGQAGFRGSSWSGLPFGASSEPRTLYPYDTAELPSAYTALVNLLVLGDDLSRVNKNGLLASIRRLRREDGSFAPIVGSHESDLRFVYISCAVSYILNDWSAIDTERTVAYIKRCETYDHGISASPEREAHGGLTFCAVSSLTLLDRFQDGHSSKEALIYWLLSRQDGGFHGRVNKPCDTCYSFWLGATLVNLGADDLVNKEENRKFLMTTQTPYGGFGKFAGDLPGK